MRISSNLQVGKGYLNINNMNNSFNQKDAKNPETAKLNKDTVSISPLGKNKNIIESLVKKKQKIMENKNNLISKTLEKGDDIDSIKSELSSFEEQLKNVDDEINKTLSEQLKKNEETSKLLGYGKTNIDKDEENDRFKSIVNLSSSLDKTKSITSLKKKSDGEIRILESEIKLDETRGGTSELKRNRLSELREESEKMNSKIKEDLESIRKNSVFKSNYFNTSNAFMNAGGVFNLYL